MLLAGDVGGTKTLLGLFAPAQPRPSLVRAEAFVTIEAHNLGEIVERFLEKTPQGRSIDAACFGVAGPVTGQRATLTNIPWTADAAEIARAFAIPSVTLVNDLHAMAYAVPVLAASEIVVLQPGRPVEGGNAALIAAGTGLGEALLHWVDGRYVPSPSEGGHADYSPRTDDEVGLMRALTSTYGRAEWEHVLSGPGLVNIHRYKHPHGCAECDPSADPVHAPAIITRAALEGRCAQCVDTLNMFAVAYGAEAGNLGLRCVATAGVYLGGGIAPKILPALETPAFLDAFRSKSPLTALVESMPVSVILNEQAALLGAAVRAAAATAAGTSGRSSELP